MARWVYFRRPRTTQEKRKWYSKKEAMGEYKLRKPNRRRPVTLVSSYDDIGRSDYRIRSWKNYRKKQYKEKKND